MSLHRGLSGSQFPGPTSTIGSIPSSNFTQLRATRPAPNESHTPSRRLQFMRSAIARRRNTGSRHRQAVTNNGTMGDSSKDGEKDEGCRVFGGGATKSAGAGDWAEELCACDSGTNTSVDVLEIGEGVEMAGWQSYGGEKEPCLSVAFEAVADSLALELIGVCENESGRNTIVDGPGGGGVGVVAGFGAKGRSFAGGGCGVLGPLRGGDEVEVEEDGELGRARMGRVSARSTIVLKESTSESHAISLLSPAPAAMMVRAIIAYIFKSVFPAYIFGSPCSCAGMFCWYRSNLTSHSSKDPINCVYMVSQMEDSGA